MAFIRISLRYLSLSLGILAFCIALAGGMLWVLWAAIGDEPATASRWLSAFLGREVQIGDIDLRWQGFGPKLRLSKVQVMDSQTGRQLLSFREIYLNTTLSHLMTEGEWMPRQLTIVGGQLTAERKSEGCIRVRGLQSLEAPCPHLSHLPEWLLKLDRLTLINVEIRWIDPLLEREPLDLKIGELHLNNDRNVHWVEGKAILPGEFGRQVALRAKFTGREIGGFENHGTLYLKSEGLQLAHWQAHHFLYGLHFTEGAGNLELGLRWEKATLRQVVAKFDWKRLQIAGNTQAVGVPDAVSFQQLAGTAHYQHLAEGWSLEIPDLLVVRADKAWPITTLQVKVEREPALQLEGRLKFIRLQDIVALLQLSDRIDPRLRLFLTEVQPVGEMQDIKVVLPLRKEQAGDWKLSAIAENVGTQPWRHWPGYQGLSFELQLAGRGGQLRINSRNIQLLSDYLEEPVALGTLEGRVTWLQREGGWRILADSIQLQNQDLALTGSLRLNKEPGKSIPYLGFSLILEEMDLTALSRYLPSRSMRPGLVRWLNHAFSKGRVMRGNLLFYGPLDHFSFRKNGGQFTADLDIRGATLNYANGWPALERADAHLHSDGQHITVNVAKGRMFNAQVIDAMARIADLDAAIIPLTVVGRARGDAEDVRRFIQQSPLQKKYGEFIEEIEANGSTRLNLKLGLAIGNNKKQPKVAGELIFDNAYLRQCNNPFLEFTTIKGGLYFTEAGLASRSLVAQLLEQPVKVDLRSLPNQAGDGVVQLSLDGRMEAQQLTEKWFPSLSSWLQGVADFSARMTFQKAKAGGITATKARVSSDLKGIEVTLPVPLAKPADQARKLLWEIHGFGGDKKQVTIAYGEQLHGIFEVKSRGKSLHFLKGEVRAGSGLPVLPEQGVRLVGTLPNLSISAWQKVFAMAVQGDSSSQTSFNNIALQVDRVELFGWRFGDVTIEANRVPSHWQARVTAPTLRGSITIPAVDPNGLLVIDLDYLDLHSRSSDSEFQLTDPRLWPALDLMCRQCWYNDYNLGVIQARASTYADGLYLKQLEIVSPLAQLKASGDWAVHEETQWSHLDIKAYSSDLGRLLTGFGYQNNIAGGEMEAKIVAGWPGSPALFALKRLNGSMQLIVGKGRLLDVEPGAGRLFGLFSVSALPRRLALDFSDILGKGFAFDQIKGIFSIHQGDAYSNELIMEGPTARVQASGRIGLVTQDYDQVIAITPHIFSSLPLAGAVAGGPIGLGIGTALMLADKVADKVFGAQVGQLLTYYYTVSGPWTKLLAPK
jgi:uncharacterized protein (TIGR02099 family)